MQEVNELKNLVIQSLEGNGVLGQIRAQIRASVFKIVEMQETNTKKSGGFFWENPLCQTIYDNKEGKVALEIINDFLEFFKMEYSLSVFTHEANLKDAAKREELQGKLGLKPDASKPVLFHLINSLLSDSNHSKENQASSLTSKPAELSKSPGDKPKTNLVKNIANDLKNAEAPNKNFDSFDKNKKTGFGGFGEPVESKDKFDSGPKGKLAPLSSLSPQDQFGVNKAPAGGDFQANKFGNDNVKKADNLQTTSQDKFNTAKEESDHDYDDDVFEEDFVEDLEDEDDPKNKDKKAMFTSSEDIIGASQSQGFDVSVDSLALEEYDYYEDAGRPKK